MNYSKSLLVLALGLSVSACDDFEDKGTTQSTGSANFTKYFAVGNSITAGFQSNALFEAGQMKSYPKLIADRVGTSFAIPTITGDGIGGKIKWDGTMSATGSPVFTYAATQAGAPNNTAYYATANYNNLGIPGMITVIPGTSALGHATDFFDVNVNSTATDALVGPGGVGGTRANPFFNVVLANGLRGSNVWTALKASQPTFVSMWLGNNDVLGYATSGGTSPSAPTDPTIFEAKYTAILDSILSLASAPNVVVGTIPNVTTIPFFTTVNASLTSLPASLVFQKSTESTSQGSGVATTADLKAYKHMVTLLGSSYAANLGKQYGGWIKRLADSQSLTVAQFYAAVLVPAGVDTTKPFGFSPQNPFPNYLILDNDEIQTATAAVANLNAKIKSVAAAASRTNRVAVADVSTEFNRIFAATAAKTSVYYQGIPVTTAFITGGLFSYDGVHPSDLGHGIVANLFIHSINAKFGATIKEVQLSNLSGTRFGKLAPGSSAAPVVIPEQYLLNTLQAAGAEF